APSVLENGEIPEVPVPLLIVEPVTHDELRSDPKPFVPHIEFRTLPSLFREQRADLERFRTPRLQVPEEVVQRETRVDDVFYNEDVLAFDLMVEVLPDPDDARCLRRRSVARDRHEVEAKRAVDLSREVGKEDGRTFQHAHEHGLAVRVVG